MKENLEKENSGNGVKVHILVSIITAWVSFYVYKNQFGGIGIALLIMFNIFFHELGHYLTAKYMNEETNGIYFVPYFGAVTLFNKNLKIKSDAIISLMGPVFGVVISGVYLVLYVLSKNHILLSAGIISLFINLANLIPMVPLDGGHIFLAILKSFKSKIFKWLLFVPMLLGSLLFSFVDGYFFVFVILAVVSSVFAFVEPVKSALLQRKDMVSYVMVYWAVALVTIWLVILVLNSITVRELIGLMGISL